MSYHNMNHLMQSMRGQSSAIAEDSKAFDDWLAETMALKASKRESRLLKWEEAPSARACHPREEHLMPLMVCAGAAQDDVATLPYRDLIMNAHVSAVQFG